MIVSPETALVETSDVHPVRNPRRCTAKSKRSGDLCGNFALKGHRTCAFHGGKTPIALEKAKEAIERSDLELRGLSTKAVAVLRALLDEGNSESVMLGAAKDVLDRGGLKAKDRLEVEASITVTRPW